MRLQAQLRKFNREERYSRFAALDGHAFTEVLGIITAGEHACFGSYYTALESGRSRRSLSKLFSLDEGGILDDFDIVFTDTVVDLDLELLRNYKKPITLSLGGCLRPITINI